ncbi:MAG TPA: MerR family transcriptional regulator, partial [Myxococcota bacterium]|nr:MerR family transcriptional regulator [Myxococcota bacterium]
MASWQIKEMSEKTGISERMLRHFDKLGLVRPSRRASNLYRSYSEQDLAVLQQIVALRYFGFSLKEIKAMLQKDQ